MQPIGAGARIVALAAALALALILPASAPAATISVNTTLDQFGTGAECALREAVQAANTNATVSGCLHDGVAATDTINLQAGAHALTLPGAEDANASGDLDLTAAGPVIIQGAAIDANDRPVSIIDGNNADRLVDVKAGAGDVDLLALELRNGNVPGVNDDGGAVQVISHDADFQINTVIARGNDAGDNGGAVYYNNAGPNSTLYIEQSEFGGPAPGDANAAGDEGGALWIDAPDLSFPAGPDPQILNSAFVGNTAATMGGALYIETRAMDGPQVFITNSTFSGNSATLGGGALAFDQAEGGNAYFNFSTIANNTTATAGGGGGINTSPPAGLNGQFVLLTASIIAGNTAAGSPSNCVGPANFSGSGTSIESTNSCGLDTGTSLVNTDPQLAPLAINPGGELTTRTHGLYNESPAVNRLPASSCTGPLAIDQRYVPRPVGGSCDVGAHEGTVGPNPNPPGAGGGGATTPVTKCKKKKKKKKKKRAAPSACKKKKKKKKKT